MDLRSHFDGWKAAMLAGEISDTHFSTLTVKDYMRRIELLLSEYGDLTFDNFKAAMRAIPPTQLGKQAKLYKAVVCFAKYLHAENLPIDQRLVVINGSTPIELAPFKPKKNKAPKQTIVTAGNLKKLLKGCQNDFERLVVVFLSTTGLRASEACSVTIGDCDLTECRVNNIKGKGGKTRRVSLMPSTIKAIKTYLSSRPSYNPLQTLFVRPDGKVFNRYDLSRLLNAIGKRAGVKSPPHSLRRAYVTISHANGAPLDHLKHSCGHSSINTTIGYCKAQETEVLDFMKNMEIIPDEIQ